MTQRTAPIGIFDSGIGGLSVLRHISEQLPKEYLLFFADSAFAPYGEKKEAIVIERSLFIAKHLISKHCKALVVACNTATAVAIHLLREKYPNLPIVGVEPGLKPAAAITKTQIVGVLATERTLQSKKFQKLYEQLNEKTTFLLQACPGLAACVENNECDNDHVYQLLKHYIDPLLKQKADTLVLGCTHYPFLKPCIDRILASYPPIHIIDTGLAVTRQLIRLLEQHDLLSHSEKQAGIMAITTGDVNTLQDHFLQLLHLTPPVQKYVAS